MYTVALEVFSFFLCCRYKPDGMWPELDSSQGPHCTAAVMATGESTAAPFNLRLRLSLAEWLRAAVFVLLQVDVWQCTYPDGLDVFYYPSQQVEGHFPSGRKEVIFADGAARIVTEDG